MSSDDPSIPGSSQANPSQSGTPAQEKATPGVSSSWKDSLHDWWRRRSIAPNAISDDATSAKHSAYVAGVCAILAALIALVGVTWTNHTTRVSIETQLTKESERSRAEFLRGQRQPLYARILADEEPLVRSKLAMQRQVYAYLAKPWSEFPSSLDGMDEAFETWKAHYATVAVLASDEVEASFQRKWGAYDSHRAALHGLAQNERIVRDPKSTEEEKRAARDRLARGHEEDTEAGNALHAEKEEFVKWVRRDMGICTSSPPLPGC